METKIIGAIPKSDICEIRVTSQQYKGRPVIDIRLWYIPDGSSELVPSRKGFTIDQSKVKELTEIFQSI